MYRVPLKSGGHESVCLRGAASCRVTGLTLSKEQLAEATARVAAAGLSDKVTLLFCDYRYGVLHLLAGMHTPLCMTGWTAACFLAHWELLGWDGTCGGNLSDCVMLAMVWHAELLMLCVVLCVCRDCPGLGGYDKVVSIEMIEAVGHEHLHSYFATINAALKPGGKAVIQVRQNAATGPALPLAG